MFRQCHPLAAALCLALLLGACSRTAAPAPTPAPPVAPPPAPPPPVTQPPAPPVTAPTAWIDASQSPFAVRGIIEGFFGAPWTQAKRLATLDFLAHVGMNTYVYAPKDDAYQRSRWRQPYPESGLPPFRTLLARAAAGGVNFVYSISPGLDVTYSSAGDRQALAAKVEQLRSLGVHTFMLSLDDVPEKLTAADVARYGQDYALAQAELANWLYSTERAAGGAFELWVTPSHYWGVKPDPYLSTLGGKLDPAIALTWTGPDVISEKLTAADTDTLAAVLRRKPLIWDNYPVNDYTYVQKKMPRLILGPLRGREAGLAAHVAGYLLNPMLQAEASQLPLYTAAAYLAHPAAYDPATAWREAAQHLATGPNGAQALLDFAAFAQISGIYDAEAPQLTAAIAAYQQGAAGSAAALEQRFAAMTTLPDRLQGGIPAGMYDEMAPWIGALQAKGRLGLLALTVDAAVGRRDAGTVKAKLPELEQSLAAVKAGNAKAYIAILLVENFAAQVVTRARALAG